MNTLYEKLLSRNLLFHHVCEVGVYNPEAAHLIDFIRQGVRTTLLEADPDVVKKLSAAFPADHVHIHPVAVWDTNGTLVFSKAGASTFAIALPSSPALENDGHRIHEADTFEVPCVQFSTIDDGSIDLLSVDIEGGEWYVLKHMLSRPRVLSIETHGKYYTNPFLSEITGWLQHQGYVLWYMDRSDSVYIQQGLFPITYQEKAAIAYAQLYIGWSKLKGWCKRKLTALW